MVKMHRLKRLSLAFGLAAAIGVGFVKAADAEQLTIGYSDWPGYVAWQVAIDKGWFKQAGLDVNFQWFDYSASLDAFASKQIDAVTTTNTDTLVMGSGGGKGIMIVLLDYSNGNDMLIATSGIKSIRDLKGKKVGVEVGVLEQLLLDNALASVGMTEKDVTLVNSKTNDLPQVLASGQVSAVVTWQPVSNTALKLVSGSHTIYTSAQAPGLLYDAITVNPESLGEHRADWLKIVKIWGRVVEYINNPKTQDDAVKIMSSRDGLTPAAYKAFLGGTRLLTLQEGQAAYKKGPGLQSLYGSTENANAFNLRVGSYTQSQSIDQYIDPSLTDEVLK